MMKEIFSFENLDVWHKSLSLANLVYTVTVNFPYHEKRGLASQMRDAAVSITSYIAASNCQISKSKESNSIEAAYKALMELIATSSISEQLGYISSIDYVKLRMETDAVAWLIHSLRSTSLEDAKIIVR